MATATPGTEQALVAALQRRDEAAFMELVRRHHALMVRVARGYVRSQAVAERRSPSGVLASIRAVARVWQREQ